MTSRLPAHARRAILFAVVSLLLTCPLAVRASPPPQTDKPRPAGRNLKRPGGLRKFGKHFLDFLICKKANERLRQELLAYGPQMPDRYDPSDFSFKALVNTNWPMAVEYELERQGTAVITVKVMGAPDFRQTLAGEGIGRRSALRFTLPVYQSYPKGGPYPALISFKATRPGPSGDGRADFIFHGAGAGPDAVTSRLREPNGVEVAGLGPLPRGLGRNVGSPARRRFDRYFKLDITFGRGPGGYVFSFKTNGRFNRWGADIVQKAWVLGSNKDKLIVNAGDREESVEPDDPVEGKWDGMAGRKKVRPGEYSLRVRLWVAVYGSWRVEDYSKPFAIG